MVLADQMNRQVVLPPSPPQRIISLVPSQTELLYDLGLGDRIVGITKFCVHPRKWFKEKTRIGGTKKIKKEVIENCKPDLIIGNKEENTKEDIEFLQEHYPVWMSDITTVDDALEMIAQVGLITDKQSEAKKWVETIKVAQSKLPPLSKSPSVAYFIWRKPWMVVGRDTYIHEFMKSCGFKNAFGDRKRYPSITLDSLPEREIDFVFLSSEPYPFKEKHLNEIREFLPKAHLQLVDGEMFSWYGSRMKRGFDYLAKIIKELPEPQLQL